LVADRELNGVENFDDEEVSKIFSKVDGHELQVIQQMKTMMMMIMNLKMRRRKRAAALDYKDTALNSYPRE
jgi:hypothetical protein